MATLDYTNFYTNDDDFNLNPNYWDIEDFQPVEFFNTNTEQQNQDKWWENELVSTIGGAFVKSLIGIGGGQQEKDTIRYEADFRNEQTKRRYQYDHETWKLNIRKLQQNYVDLLQSVYDKAERENTIANASDANKVANYIQELQIRNKRQEALNAQYLKSDSIFKNHISFNSQTAQRAREDELTKLEEIKAEAVFDANANLIEQMELTGQMQARATSGNSSQKKASVAAMKYGFNVAMLNASLESAEVSTKRTIEGIELDRSAANLAAYANRMLDPGEELMPIKPFATPRAKFRVPRAIEDFDIGVPPIEGIAWDPSSQISAVNWSTAGDIAGIFSDAFSSSNNQTKQSLGIS